MQVLHTADLVLLLYASIADLCLSLVLRCHKLVFAISNPSLFHLKFQRGIFGEENNGGGAMGKT